MSRTHRRPRVMAPNRTQPPAGAMPIDVSRLESLALAGSPEDEIAAYFGVSIEAVQPYQQLIARCYARGKALVRRKAFEEAILHNHPGMLILLARERCGFQHDDLVRQKLQAEVDEKKLRVELCKSAVEEQKIVLQDRQLGLEERQLGVQLRQLELLDGQRKERVAASADKIAELEHLDPEAEEEKYHRLNCEVIRSISNLDELDAEEKRMQKRRQDEDEAIRSCRAELLRPMPSTGQPECQSSGGDAVDAKGKSGSSGERAEKVK